MEPYVLKAHNSHVNYVIFSHDNAYLISAGMDNVNKVWEIGTWELKRTLAGHQKSSNSLALTRDNSILISIKIEEGIQFKVGKVALEGDLIRPEEELLGPGDDMHGAIAVNYRVPLR